MKTILLICSIIAGAVSFVAASPKQFNNLPTPQKPRFEVKDISWPEQYGQLEICLWKDDKYAALSITIDDNCKPDHEWWLEQSKEFGFPLTWFVITDRVGKNKSFSGVWEDFVKLQAAGHSIQSHTVNHQKNDDARSDDVVREEYSKSKEALERHIPGNRCLAIAYPYGKGKPELAREYFIAGRGTTGAPNQANMINYMNTNGGHLKAHMVDAVLGNPIEAPRWLNNPRFKRGWLSLLHHSVARGRTAEAKAESTAQVREFLEYVAKNKDKLWVDTFVNVAKYGQQRDSAVIDVHAVEADKISFSISDDMNDSIFDMPLTVKIKLNDNWKTLQAVQADKPVEAVIVEHKGNKFALVQAIPDAGTVVLNREK